MDSRSARELAAARPVGWLTRIGLRSRTWLADRASSRAVGWWHGLLCAVAALNLILWARSAVALPGGHDAVPAGSDGAWRLQLCLSAVYVLGCAYRSALPVYDIPRRVLVDSSLSGVFVGRSVATVAELCFAAQWAFLLRGLALPGGSAFVHAVSLAIVPLIAVAEGFSWHAVLTTAQRGHVVENSIWGLSALLVIAALGAVGAYGMPALYPAAAVWGIGGVAYIAFIFLLDVPMYRARWLAEQSAGRRYLSLAEGIDDARRRRVVSHRWEDWKSEVPWMSLYFTIGVWSSLSLLHVSRVLAVHRP